MTTADLSRTEYREAAVRHFAGHQPRERSCPCQRCGRPTLNFHAVCDRCRKPEDHCDRCPPEPARDARHPNYWAEAQPCPGCGVEPIWAVGGLCRSCTGDFYATRPTAPARLWGLPNGGSVE